MQNVPSTEPNRTEIDQEPQDPKPNIKRTGPIANTRNRNRTEPKPHCIYGYMGFSWIFSLRNQEHFEDSAGILGNHRCFTIFQLGAFQSNLEIPWNPGITAVPRDSIRLPSGWPTPQKNDGVRQLGWWHSQYDGKNNNCSKPPTSYIPTQPYGKSCATTITAGFSLLDLEIVEPTLDSSRIISCVKTPRKGVAIQPPGHHETTRSDIPAPISCSGIPSDSWKNDTDSLTRRFSMIFKVFINYLLLHTFTNHHECSWARYSKNIEVFFSR